MKSLAPSTSGPDPQDHEDDPGEKGFGELDRELRRVLQQQGLIADLVDDVAQETWLRTLRRPRVQSENLFAWLRVVSRNLTSEWRRTDRHRRDRELERAREAVGAVPPDVREESVVLRRVAELPDPYGRAIRLRYVEGLTPQEIARLLGVPASTVRSWLKRGLDLLRERLPAETARRSLLFELWLWLTLIARRVRGGWASSWKVGLAVRGAALIAAGIVISLALRPTPVRGAFQVAEALPGDVVPPSRLTPVGSGAPGRGAPPSWPADAGPPPELEGIVLDPDGRPVVAAAIHVGPPRGASATEPRTYSNGEGRFQLSGLGEDAVVWAAKDGWIESARGYVTTAGSTKDFELRLEAGVRRRVRVLDPEGRPLPHAQVEFDNQERLASFMGPGRRQDFSPGPVLGETDDEGEVELVLPEGRALLCSVEAGACRGRILVGSLEGGSASEPLTVRLPVPSSIEGRVLDSGRKPVARVRVTAFQYGMPPVEVRTGGDGSYSMDGLRAGRFVLRAVPEDPASPWESYARAGFVEAEARMHQDVVLDPAFDLHGRIETSRSLVGAVAEITPKVLYRWEGTTEVVPVNADGAFHLGGCLPIPHDVLIRFPGGEPISARGTWEPGTFESRPLDDRPAPRSTLTVALALAPSAVQPSTLEIRNFVSRESKMVPLAPDQTSVDLTDLPHGEYRVLTWTPGVGPWHGGSLKHEEPGSVFTLGIPPPALLRVRLVSSGDVDLASVRASVVLPTVNAAGFDGGGASLVEVVMEPSGDGTFEVEVMPGRYRLSVQGPGIDQELGISVRDGPSEEQEIILLPSHPIAIQLDFARPLLQGESLSMEALNGAGERLLKTHLRRATDPELFVPDAARTLRFHTAHKHRVPTLSGQVSLWGAPVDLGKVRLDLDPQAEPERD